MRVYVLQRWSPEISLYSITDNAGAVIGVYGSMPTLQCALWSELAEQWDQYEEKGDPPADLDTLWDWFKDTGDSIVYSYTDFEVVA